VAFPRIEIRTNRLLLRPWRMTDIDDAFAYGSDPEWGRYLWNTPYPYTLENARQFVTWAANDAWDTHALFAIELERRVIGGVRLYVTDAPGRITGTGLNLARTHWGQGYATEAWQAVLSFAFETAGIHRVYATADSRNIASMRVLEKLGMSREGVLRQHHLHRGEYADEVIYGMLSREWHGVNPPGH
jgi:ribosomal-protein-alanine N-acetyltransferase